MAVLTRRTCLVFVAAALILLGHVPAISGGTAPERSVHLTILQLNDLSDVRPGEQGTRGGLARVATIRDRVAAESPHTLLVIAGDFLSPSTMSSLFQGGQMVAALNESGLDLATFGNHEFDFGEWAARERMRESRFTWVSSNVLEPRTGLPFGEAAAFVLRDVEGVKVAFLGLTTPDTRKLSKGGRGLKLVDPISAAKEVVARARRAKADLIVALTHQDMAADKRLAAAVPGIDLILGGHEHVPLDAQVGSTLILKTGSDAANVGRIDLQVVTGRTRRVETAWTLIPVTDQIPEKPEVVAVVKQYEAMMTARLDVRAGETRAPLDSRTEIVRRRESALGNFVADVIRDAMYTDVAIVNGGALHANTITPVGPLTQADVLRLLPFANRIVKLEVTGDLLRAAIENGFSQVEKTAGRFPQVSGLRLVFDPQQPAGSRLLSAVVRGRPLESEAHYTLATFEFLAGGGDGYDMLRHGKVLARAEDGPMDSDLVLERLQAGPIEPYEDGRIQSVEAIRP
jgi:2',3'-cyclic-nucleotide 2'-phosphodiesterase (5'-nucleotidase family)